MNLFNKTEVVGIFLSIAVMAVALGVVRFKTDILVAHSPSGESQGAVVVGGEKDAVTEDDALEKALTESYSPSGELVKLVVDDVRIGTGAEVKKGDTVEVHYIGATEDGVRFDSSYDRGKTFAFTVGAGQVIKGWEEGLIGMKVGGQRILVIPGDMAYGNRQVGVIPPNAPLVFAVELIKIH